MKNILKRLKEPSTWSGLAVLAVLAGVDQHKVDAVQQALVAVAGLLAVILPETNTVES